MEPIKSTLNNIKNRITQHSFTGRTWKEGERLQKSLGARMLSRMALFRDDVEETENRLKVISAALATQDRLKRGLIDGGGLKWLFGVSTNSNLESVNTEVNRLKQSKERIIHLVQNQATLINESLVESRANTKLLGNLYRRVEALSASFQHWASRVEQSLGYLQQLDTIIDFLGHALEWLHRPSTGPRGWIHLVFSVVFSFVLFSAYHLRYYHTAVFGMSYKK